MDTKPRDRALRVITIFALVPALAFLIPHGAETEKVFPALGLIPAGFSAIIGLWHAAGYRMDIILTVLIDTFLACFLIGMLVPGWVVLGRDSWSWRDTNGMIMLATYGTVPLMIDFCIHTYLALRDMMGALRPYFSKMFCSPFCPHCQREVLFHWQMPGSSRASSVHSRASYSPVKMVDDEIAGRESLSKEPMQEPRPSTDDETARLV